MPRNHIRLIEAGAEGLILRIRQLAGSRLGRGSAAMVYGQVVQLAIQLAILPVMVREWGLVGFGQWLLIFTLPSLLTMSDVGLVAALGNAMTAAVALEDYDKARQLYVALRTLLVAVCLVLSTLAMLAVALWPSYFDSIDLPGGAAGAVVITLVAYAMLGVFNSAIMAGHRATDGFALSNIAFQSVVLIEALGALLTVWFGGTALDAALVYLFLRAIGTALLSLLLRARAPWLTRLSWSIDWGLVRPLVVPAISTLPLPLAYAVTLQGAVLAVGATAGVASIPAFSATRTLTRTALQLTFAVNVASMPRFTVAAARGDIRRQDQLVIANLLISVALLVPAAILFLTFGPAIIRLWTNGGVLADPRLLAALTAAMLLNGAWVPISNLILSVNLHSRYTWFFLMVALVGTAGGYVAALWLGALGAALGVVAIEAAMIFHIWRISFALGLVNRRRLFSQISEGFLTIRSGWHR